MLCQMKKHVITIVALFLITCLTRIPFATKCICEHDSVNFALAIESFDIAKHQPHPPGYILYVGLAKFLNLFFKDINKNFIILSILFSAIAVVLIYLLGKEIFNYRCGLISGLFLLSSPVFWAYGELALSYTAENLFFLLIAYMAYQVIRGKRQYILWMSIALGVGVGMRQNLILYLLPLWIRGLVSLRSWKEAGKQVLIFGIVCLLWFIPLMVLSEGFHKYWSVSKELGGSMLLSKFNPIKNVAYMVVGSLWTLGAILIGIFMSLKRLNGSLAFRQKKELLIFFALWGGPSLLFFLVFSIGKSVHTLNYILPIIVLSTVFVFERWRVLDRILVGIIIGANCLLFFMVRPLSIGEQIMGINTDKVKNFANFWVLDHSNKGLRQKEKVKETFDFIKKNFSSEKSAICVASGGNFQPYIPWRTVYYYLPEFSIFKIGDEVQVIELKPKIETIIWLVDKYDLKRYKNIKLNKVVDKGEEIYFSSIEDTLTIENFKFYKEE